MPKRLSKESSSNTHLFAAPDVNNTNFGFDSEFVLFFDSEYSALKSISSIRFIFRAASALIQNKNFSIVRVRVLSESENRRFTSTDFDADLQAFKHEKSPMKSDFFGQISFLSPQYACVLQNLVFEAIFDSVSDDK